MIVNNTLLREAITFSTERKRVFVTDQPLKLDKPPEDILKEGTLSEYEQGMNFFSAYLVELNTNLYIVERIFQFPFDLLFPTSEGSTIFFGQVVRNALQMSVLCITKLVSDAGDGLYTLRQFKNKVVHMVKPEYQQAFRERLKVAWDDSAVQDLLQRAKNLRNTRIAHFHQSFVQESFDSTMKQEHLLVSEAEALRDKLNDMFQALAFGVRYGTLPVSYEIGRPDIEDVLIGYAGRSSLLNMPERNPGWWHS